MKGLFMILQYYFNWQFVTRWSGTTGFLLFILSVVLFFITQNNTDIPLLRNVSVLSPYVVLLLAYLCLLIIPLISSPIAFRALISNRQLGLIPGFRFKAGLALLMLTLLTSFFIFLFNSILNGFSTQRLPLLYFSLNLFCLCSVFIMAFQFALTSRYFVFQVSLGFMFVILLLYLFDRYLLALLNQTIYIYFSTLVCSIGWLIGFRVLLTKTSFKPSAVIAIQQSPFSSLDMSWLAKLNFGTMHSAAGTMLFGIPDGMPDKLKSTFDICVFSPFISAIILFYIGFGEDWPIRNEPLFPILFLSFSLILSSLSNRIWLWHYLERALFSNLMVLYLMSVLACILIFLFSGFSPVYLFHYLFSLLSYTLFIAYFSLAARMFSWPVTLLTLVFIGVFTSLMSISFIFLLDGLIVAKLTIDGSLLLGSLYMRLISRRAFQKIDWVVIKPDRPGSSALQT